ncbi:hypothetical protein E2C01_048723 [Portunus trituberculatus]|uniref:Uncharacterized protein n=1 Tax=Portunus trituberculatus TaxID=210409 RepID=A0A5B7GBR9_PORTR|nr:hypothetical protein [Portunus trituberculatus]
MPDRTRGLADSPSGTSTCTLPFSLENEGKEMTSSAERYRLILSLRILPHKSSTLIMKADRRNSEPLSTRAGSVMCRFKDRG